MYSPYLRTFMTTNKTLPRMSAEQTAYHIRKLLEDQEDGSMHIAISEVSRWANRKCGITFLHSIAWILNDIPNFSFHTEGAELVEYRVAVLYHPKGLMLHKNLPGKITRILFI